MSGMWVWLAFTPTDGRAALASGTAKNAALRLVGPDLLFRVGPHVTGEVHCGGQESVAAAAADPSLKDAAPREAPLEVVHDAASRTFWRNVAARQTAASAPAVLGCALAPPALPCSRAGIGARGGQHTAAPLLA